MYPCEKGGAWELYDTATDRTELNDLSEVEPKRLEEMIRAYDSWAARVGVVPRDQLGGKRE